MQTCSYDLIIWAFRTHSQARYWVVIERQQGVRISKLHEKPQYPNVQDLLIEWSCLDLGEQRLGIGTEATKYWMRLHRICLRQKLHSLEALKAFASHPTREVVFRVGSRNCEKWLANLANPAQGGRRWRRKIRVWRYANWALSEWAVLLLLLFDVS